MHQLPLPTLDPPPVVIFGTTDRRYIAAVALHRLNDRRMELMIDHRTTGPEWRQATEAYNRIARRIAAPLADH